MRKFNFCFWINDCENILPEYYYGDISGAIVFAKELANNYNNIINVIDFEIEEVVSTVYPDDDIKVDIDSIDFEAIKSFLSLFNQHIISKSD